MVPQRAAPAGLTLVASVVAASLALYVPVAGRSPDGAQALERGLYLLDPLAVGLCGAVIARRRPANPVGWLLLLVAVVKSLENVGYAYASAILAGQLSLVGAQWGAWLDGWLWPIALGCVALIIQTFPDGRCVSGRWRPLAYASVIASGLVALSLAVYPGPHPSFGDVWNPLALSGPIAELLVWLVPVGVPGLIALMLVLSVAAVGVRFRRARGEQRQQLKWFAYAVVINVIVQSVAFAGWFAPWWQLLNSLVAYAVPVSIMLAILKYRLYEIDRLINRTLVYGVLTLGLAATYWSGVAVLQQVLRPLTQGSDLAIVASTLAVAAMFQPLRRRIQQTVDRRLYRSRYDAARTLETFGMRLRDELDLDTLTAELLQVVRRTMQPTESGLWLRSASPPSTQAPQ